MKNIKFRAWNSVFSEWETRPDIYCFIEKNGELNVRNHSDLIIQQFTDLSDKNGKDIYEGDILKEPSGTIVEIIWETAGFAAKHISGPANQNRISHLSECYMCGTPENSEVIGNIFQNKDLIK